MYDVISVLLFILYTGLENLIIDETELAELQNMQISLNHIITSRKFFV
jgi:hypothetical protein